MNKKSLPWRLLGLCLCLFICPLLELPGQVQDESVTVRVVKYDQLTKEVARHRGKVVLVDFWATYCVPCLKNFPHLVELHKQHEKKGLVIISVSIDSIKKNSDIQNRVLQNLKGFSAPFTNLILDESPEVLEQKLRITAIPAVYLFDRQGKWVPYQDEEVRIADIAKKVEEFLEKK